MQYEAFREDDEAGEPSIAEMTEKAIRILRKNEKGFFLAIEGECLFCIDAHGHGWINH